MIVFLQNSPSDRFLDSLSIFVLVLENGREHAVETFAICVKTKWDFDGHPEWPGTTKKGKAIPKT